MKLLIVNNFAFCYNVFKSRWLQTRQKASICGKGLNRNEQCISLLECGLILVNIVRGYCFELHTPGSEYGYMIETSVFENQYVNDSIDDVIFLVLEITKNVLGNIIERF